MRTFWKTAYYLLRAQLRMPLFYLAVALLLAVPLTLLGMRHSPLPVAALYDADGSALSRQLAAQAQKSGAMQLDEIKADALDAALLKLRNGGLEAVFVIEAGYGQRLTGGDYAGAVKLYVSPYSTSAKTLSDILAAGVMAQWAQQEACAQAERLSPGAGADAARLYAQDGQPILLLSVAGEAALVQGEDAGPAQNALFALSALSCLMLLCLPGDAAPRRALLERFASRGQGAAGYLFARPVPWAVLPALAALPVAIRFAAQRGMEGLLLYLCFLLYLVWLMGLCVVLDLLVPGPAARAPLAFTFAVANAMVSYPGGLLQGAGVFRYFFGGYWLAVSGWASLPPLAALALGACLAGITLSNRAARRQ